MKKFIFLIAFLVSGIICFAQDYGVIYTFPATTSKAQFHIAKKNFMYVTSTKGYYAVLKDIPAGTLASSAIADLTWVYPVGATVAATASITTLAATTATITTAVLGGKNLTTKNTNGGTYAGSLTLASGDTLFLGTQALWANNTNGIKANNSLTATDSIFSPVVSATSSLILPGTNIFTRKNANGVSFDGSLTVGNSDTIYAGNVYATTGQLILTTQTMRQNHINNVLFNNSVTATDTVFGAVAKTTIVNLVTAAASDTATKTAGKIIYLAGYFWGCNGTYYYKLDPQH